MVDCLHQSMSFINLECPLALSTNSVDNVALSNTTWNTNRHTATRTDGQTDGRTSTRTDGQPHGRTDSHTDGRTATRMDEHYLLTLLINSWYCQVILSIYKRELTEHDKPLCVNDIRFMQSKGYNQLRCCLDCYYTVEHWCYLVYVNMCNS